MARFGDISNVVVGLLVSVDIGTIICVHACAILVIQCTEEAPVRDVVGNSGIAAQRCGVDGSLQRSGLGCSNSNRYYFFCT